MSHTKIGKAVILVLIVGLAAAFFVNLKSATTSNVVREYVECVNSICKDLLGVGLQCDYQKPVMTRVTVVNTGAGTQVQFKSTGDRCDNGQRD